MQNVARIEKVGTKGREGRDGQVRVNEMRNLKLIASAAWTWSIVLQGYYENYCVLPSH